MTRRTKWAITLTVIGFLLLCAFMLILMDGGEMMMEYTAAWILIGFAGAVLFNLGTALL